MERMYVEWCPYNEEIKMKVSAIVPVYNTNPEYLGICVSSILNQTYKPYELVIVNDGSTRKETIDFLNNLKKVKEKNGIKIKIIDQENKKISGALNTGIRNMKGDWWAGCSSDDMWLPNKLEEQVKFIKANKQARVVYANWVMVNEIGFPIRNLNEPEFTNLKDQQEFLKNSYFATWSNMMIHESVFKKVGLFNEEYPTCEDYEFNVRMSEYYLFHKVPKVLMMYRVHPEQLTNSEWGFAGEKGKVYRNKSKELARRLFNENI